MFVSDFLPLFCLLNPWNLELLVVESLEGLKIKTVYIGSPVIVSLRFSRLFVFFEVIFRTDKSVSWSFSSTTVLFVKPFNDGMK